MLKKVKKYKIHHEKDNEYRKIICVVETRLPTWRLTARKKYSFFYIFDAFVHVIGTILNNVSLFTKLACYFHSNTLFDNSTG